jgi:hypothetical protein
MSHQSNNVSNECPVCYQEGVVKEQMYITPCGHPMCFVCVDAIIRLYCKANREVIRRRRPQDPEYIPPTLVCHICRQNFLEEPVEEEAFPFPPEVVANVRVCTQLMEEQDIREQAGIYFNAQWRTRRIAELMPAQEPLPLPRPTLRRNDYF